MSRFPLSFLEGKITEKLLGLIFFRLVVVTVLLITTSLLNLSLDDFLSPEQRVLFFVAGVSYVLSIFHAVALQFDHHYKLQGYIQLTGDVLLWSVLTILTGSASSPFTFLYALSIIQAIALFGRISGFIIAGISSAMLLATTFADYFGLLQGWFGLTQQVTEISLDQVYGLFLNWVLFIFTAFLLSQLGARLKTMDER